MEGKKMVDSEVQLKMAELKEARLKEEAEADWSWVEVYDPASESFYYWNQNTQDMSWEKPPNYILAADDELMVAVIKVQCLYRMRQARQYAESRRWEEMPLSKWYAHEDGEGYVYYYNSWTGEKTYIKPSDFDGEGLISPALMKQLMEGKMIGLDAETHRALRKAQEQQRQAKAERDAAIHYGDEHWVEHFDEEKGEYYYIGQFGGEKTWKKPANYVMEAGDDMLVAVVKIQVAFREQQAHRREKEAQAAERIREKLAKRPQLMNKDWRQTQIWEGQQNTKILKASFQKKKENEELEMKLAAALEERKRVEEMSDLTWVEVYDSAKEAYYYWNRVTEEILWEKPEKYLMAADDTTIKSAIKLQSAFRARLARHGISIRRKKQRVWIEATDETSGHFFYYNTETGECVWEKPAAFVAGAKTDDDILKSMKNAYEDLKNEKQKKFDEAKEKRLKEEAQADWSWVEVHVGTLGVERKTEVNAKKRGGGGKGGGGRELHWHSSQNKQ
jgi:hypothetical protein